jgi:hypothetical protein
MQVRQDTLTQDICRRFPLLVGSRVALEADLNWRRDWLQTLKCVVCRRFPLLAGSRVTLEADLNGRDWLRTLQAAGYDPQVSTAAADAGAPLQDVLLPPCVGTRSKQIRARVCHVSQPAAAGLGGC